MRMTKPDEKLSLIEEQLVIDKRAVEGEVCAATSARRDERTIAAPF